MKKNEINTETDGQTDKQIDIHTTERTNRQQYFKMNL